MLKDEYIVYLCMYTCIYVKTTQWIIWYLVSNCIGLTLMVNPWLWNWALVTYAVLDLIIVK